MTHDFTPPGGSSFPGPSSDKADAHPGLSSTSGSAAARTGVGATHRRGNMFQSGRRVAFAAWVAIAAGVLLLVGIGWSAALATTDKTLKFAELGDTGTMHAGQLVLGMCVEDVGEDGPVDEVVVVPCNQPHRAEVYTQKTFNLAKHPGVEEVEQQSLAHCSDRLAGQLPEGASWVTWVPSPESWSRGDRTSLCIAVFDEAISEPLSPHGIQGIGKDRGGVGA